MFVPLKQVEAIQEAKLCRLLHVLFDHSAVSISLADHSVDIPSTSYVRQAIVPSLLAEKAQLLSGPTAL